MWFSLYIVLITVVLYLILRYIPSGSIKIPLLNKLSPLIYSIVWGIIMGSLLTYGSSRLGDPIKHILNQFLTTDVGPTTDSITEAMVVSISLVFADLFKRIFEKASNTDVDASLLETIVGFIIGRAIVIIVNLIWGTRAETELKFRAHRFD